MIYLGGSCSSEQRTLMQKIAKVLKDNGKRVYCPFELKIPNAWDYSQEDWARMVFEKDVDALNNSDIFLMISPGRMSSAGTNWEQGYAYAKGKRIIVLQFTDETTSLMTYSGCDVFINTSREKIFDDVLDAVNGKRETGICKTVLT